MQTDGATPAATSGVESKDSDETNNTTEGETAGSTSQIDNLHQFAFSQLLGWVDARERGCILACMLAWVTEAVS